MDVYAEALERIAALGRFGVVPGLEAIARLLAALGDPQRAFPAIHIAGTNGKGSTAAMAEALLYAGGVRTGLYTSPHLSRFTERVRIAGQEVSAEVLGDALRRALDAAEVIVRAGHRPATFFEVSTAAAFLAFAEARVETAVIECGLGGRWDATATCLPRVCVITSIGADHLEVLGPTLADVAREKAGIARAAVPLLVGPVDDAIARVIADEAHAAGAPLLRLGADLELRTTPTGWRYRGPGGALRGERLGLEGPHQADNAALAIAACALTGAPLGQAGEALAGVRWPGRLERLSSDLIVDGAHNPDGVAALVRALPGLGLGAPPVLLVGVLGDKDVDGLLAPILPWVAAVVCTTPPSPRAFPAEELAARVRAAAPELPVEAVAEPLSALARARHRSDGRMVLACGSLFLIGALRAAILGEPRDPIALGDPRAGAAGAAVPKI